MEVESAGGSWIALRDFRDKDVKQPPNPSQSSFSGSEGRIRNGQFQVDEEGFEH